jgi:hypothetical protein
MAASSALSRRNMKPEEFDEHISALMLPRGISVETITSCECAGFKYLIMIGKNLPSVSSGVLIWLKFSTT